MQTLSVTGGFVGKMPSFQGLDKEAWNANNIAWIRSIRPGLCPGLKTKADPVINVIHNGESRPDMAWMKDNNIQQIFDATPGSRRFRKVPQVLARQEIPVTEADLISKDASQDYACLMLHPNASDTAKLQKFFKSFISSEDVYDNSKKEYGIEDQPHITLLYGMHSDDPEHALKHFRGHSPVFCFIKGVSIFEPEGKDYDVVKFDITGGRMQELNALLTSKVEHTQTYEYHPHMTISYVKRGMGKKYDGQKTEWDGKRIMGTRMRFSSADCSEKTWMALLGKGTEKTAADSPEQVLRNLVTRAKNEAAARSTRSPQVDTSKSSLFGYQLGDAPTSLSSSSVNVPLGRSQAPVLHVPRPTAPRSVVQHEAGHPADTVRWTRAGFVAQPWYKDAPGQVLNDERNAHLKAKQMFRPTPDEERQHRLWYSSYMIDQALKGGLAQRRKTGMKLDRATMLGGHSNAAAIEQWKRDVDNPQLFRSPARNLHGMRELGQSAPDLRPGGEGVKPANKLQFEQLSGLKLPKESADTIDMQADGQPSPGSSKPKLTDALPVTPVPGKQNLTVTDQEQQSPLAAEQEMDFPEQEHSDLTRRLKEHGKIYTTRISAEGTKYTQGQTVLTPFGRLKVVSVKPMSDSYKEHPFQKELSADQANTLRGEKGSLVELAQET